MATSAVSANAGVASKAIQEALEFASQKFGKEVAKEGAERLSVRIVRLAAKHGDDIVAAALKKVGPRAGRVVAEAGEHGGLALRLLAQHGDDALPLVARATALNTVARYGDNAAAALIKHGAVGEKFVERFAIEGAQALVKVTPRNGRRLAMMAADGQLKPELMTVITKYGDRACEFIWTNKGALTVATALAAFVASPGDFLDGTQKLTAIVAEAAIKPLAEVPKTIAAEAAKNMNWTLLVFVATVVLGALTYFRMSAGRRLSRLTERGLPNELAPESPQKK
jgi:hypothetical protein